MLNKYIVCTNLEVAQQGEKQNETTQKEKERKETYDTIHWTPWYNKNDSNSLLIIKWTLFVLIYLINIFFSCLITGPPPALDDSSQQSSSGVGEGTPTHKAMADRRQLITEMRKYAKICGLLLGRIVYSTPQGSLLGPVFHRCHC